MATPAQSKQKAKGAGAKPKPNRVQVMQAIDKMPGRGAAAGGGAMGQPGQPGAPPAPAPFPFPASRLDRTASGVPNVTDMVLRSFQPEQPYVQPGMQAPAPAAAAQAQQTTNPRGAPPMSSRPQGPQPARGFAKGARR